MQINMNKTKNPKVPLFQGMRASSSLLSKEAKDNYDSIDWGRTKNSNSKKSK